MGDCVLHLSDPSEAFTSGQVDSAQRLSDPCPECLTPSPPRAAVPSLTAFSAKAWTPLALSNKMNVSWFRFKVNPGDTSSEPSSLKGAPCQGSLLEGVQVLTLPFQLRQAFPRRVLSQPHACSIFMSMKIKSPEI